jgi:hypothetical protein
LCGFSKNCSRERRMLNLFLKLRKKFLKNGRAMKGVWIILSRTKVKGKLNEK